MAIVMNGRILVIEDEPELAELITVYLEREGLHVDRVGSAEDASIRAERSDYDLLILDINLPGMDGFEFLQDFRRENTCPVMIVSAREADEDIVMGLGIGADEFVTKPFTPRVLVARVRSHLRRRRIDAAKAANRSASVYRFAGFELDAEAYRLRRDGEIVAISTREFEVLRYLVEHAGHVFSSEELYAGVWQQEFGDSMAIPVYVQRIRKKIEKDYRNPDLIVTIHGRGYRFDRGALQ
jgi:DNA-binding response OmpR family regulator